MASSSVIGAIAVIAVILTAFGSYYYTATPLNAQVSSYQSSISTFEANISSYQSVTSSMSAHPSTTTIYSTTTSTSTITTTTAYPIPDNVTVLFDSSGSYLTYRIDTSINGWGGYTDATSFNQTVTPLQSNEWISVQASCSASCNNRTNFSARLLVNDHPVSVASGNAYTGLLINYTI